LVFTKIILFDVGNILEYKWGDKDVLMPDALDLLSTIQDLHDNNGERLELGLVSNWYPDRDPVKYYKLLQDLSIDNFFKPFSQKVTLSTEVGVEKPDEKIFRTAIDKLQKDLPYRNVFFITEEKDHIIAARKYGMMAIRINLPGETGGEADTLAEILPFINLFLLM
jgi:FMN phosphatase YigB (HAD superfamily)